MMRLGIIEQFATHADHDSTPLLLIGNHFVPGTQAQIPWVLHVSASDGEDTVY
jgi:hypothetical protein